jgi:L-ascorbate metabolism protein UlaG (beta-lactamase superfamily)
LSTDSSLAPISAGWRAGECPPDTERITTGLSKAQIQKPKLKAVLVAHAHHDHAMDSATVAQTLGAVLVGSQSVRYVANGQGFTGTFEEIRGGQTISVPINAEAARDPEPAAKFRITAYCSPHSDTPFFTDPLTEDLRKDAWAVAYKSGPNFSYLIEYNGLRILVHPSAGYRSGLYDGLKVDVLFLGIGRLGRLFHQRDAEAYWREVVEATSPSIVIPIHWDDFTQPVADPLPRLKWPVDDVDHGLQRLLDLNAKRKTPYDIRLMPVWTEVTLPMTQRALPPTPPAMTGC